MELGGSIANRSSMSAGLQHGTRASSSGIAGTTGADWRDSTSAQSFNSLGICPTASRSPQRAWRRASSRQTLPRSPRPRWDTATESAAMLSPTSAALCNRPGPHQVAIAVRAVRASKKERYFDSPLFTWRPSQRLGGPMQHKALQGHFACEPDCSPSPWRSIEQDGVAMASHQSG